jgi:hypothetical protein
MQFYSQRRKRNKIMKNIFPETSKKVAQNTCDKVNAKIRYETICCINAYKDSDAQVLTDQIEPLNYEWYTERFLETGAASIILASSLLGFAKGKLSYYLLSGTVGYFLLQHALEGWCPPLPVLRALGIRTSEEINNHKTALKIIRGDFSSDVKDPEQLLVQVEKV